VSALSGDLAGPNTKQPCFQHLCIYGVLFAFQHSRLGAPTSFLASKNKAGIKKAPEGAFFESTHN